MADKKDTYYFPHDYNARKDPKLIKLFIQEKMQGIGIYWCLVEMLYEQNGYLLLSELETYAYDLRIEIEILKKVIEKYGLFRIKGEKFFSESVLKRLKHRKEKSTKARKNANLRWNANAMQTHTKSDANAMLKSKVKESKVKESKVVEKTDNLQQLIFDFFINNKQTQEEAEKFIKYNSSRGNELTEPNYEQFAKQWILNDKTKNILTFLSEYEIRVNKEISELRSESDWKEYKFNILKDKEFLKQSKKTKKAIEESLSNAYSFRIAINN